MHPLEIYLEELRAIRSSWLRCSLVADRRGYAACSRLASGQNPGAQIVQVMLNSLLTVGWGHAGQNGVTMPGKGRLATKTVEAGPGHNMPWLELHDVYLNESACWKDIPAPVWDYSIGGYQVIKKWLSYRELELLGRPLILDEAREVTHMARRIAALILFQPALDRNYDAVKSASRALA